MPTKANQSAALQLLLLVELSPIAMAPELNEGPVIESGSFQCAITNLKAKWLK